MAWVKNWGTVQIQKLDVRLGDWIEVDYSWAGDWWNPAFYGIITEIDEVHDEWFVLAKLLRKRDQIQEYDPCYVSKVHYFNMRHYTPTREEVQEYYVAIMRE